MIDLEQDADLLYGSGIHKSYVASSCRKKIIKISALGQLKLPKQEMFLCLLWNVAYKIIKPVLI